MPYLTKMVMKRKNYSVCEIEVQGFSSQERQVLLGFPQVLLFCS